MQNPAVVAAAELENHLQKVSIRDKKQLPTLAPSIRININLGFG
jgi:hypothetical protein